MDRLNSRLDITEEKIHWNVILKNEADNISGDNEMENMKQRFINT